MPPLVVSESHRAHILYCSHSDLHSDKERESDENTDDTGDEGTRGSVYDERVVEARGDTQETEIPPDANTEVSRLSPSPTSEDVDMAPPAHGDEAIRI